MSDSWSTPNPSANQPPTGGEIGGYQPHAPQPYGADPGQAGVIEHAGFWIRFAGALIDGIILSIVQAILTRTLGDGVGWLLSLAIYGGYFTFLHSTKAGQTIGQKAVGIRLVDAATGGQVDPGRAAVRWLMSYVSAFALLIGYLWMLWDPDKQTWHDKVAKTFVVKAQAHPAPTQSMLDR